MQFHIFTISLTIIIYMYLRYQDQNQEGKNSAWYAIFVPILIYSFNYFSNFSNVPTNLNQNSIGVSSVLIDDANSIKTLMTDTYPMSSSN